MSTRQKKRKTNAKLNIANGIVMSKILYLLLMYGGCPEYLRFKLNKTKQCAKGQESVGLSWESNMYRLETYLTSAGGSVSDSIQKTLMQQTPEYLLNKSC